MLRRFVGAVVALVICAGSLPAEEIKGQVAWLVTWKQALAEAKRTGKPILLAFGKPACEQVPGLW